MVYINKKRYIDKILFKYNIKDNTEIKPYNTLYIPNIKLVKNKI